MTDEDNIAFKSISYGSIEEDSAQFLGSHELYWFPYMQFLLARLSDGRSFKLFKFAPDFDA